MEQVLVGNMLPGATQFKDQNVNPTWKAHVQTQDGIKVAFVKIVDPRSLYVECVCALIGRSLSLPIPMPIIVKVTDVALPIIPKGKVALAFGSEDAQYPSFRRFVNQDNDKAMQKLAEFSKTLDVGIFDEWIANWDRNLGNMLYDGNKNFYFIDHENAIPAELPSNKPATSNEILRCIYSGISELDKYRISKKVSAEYTQTYSQLPFSLISDRTFASKYLAHAEIINIINFLTTRLQSLTNLCEVRLGIRQQGLPL